MGKKRLGFTDKQLKQIRIVIGKNLAAARRNAGMTQAEVMSKVWGVENTRNRISEIENGNKDLTLVDLLIFQNLYGQSLDYICGLSTEPELDMLASTVNHVVNQSRGMVEHLTQELATTLVEHIKAISKNDHEALLEESKALCGAIIDSKLNNPIVTKRLANLMRTVRRIESKQARQAMAVETHVMQVK